MTPNLRSMMLSGIALLLAVPAAQAASTHSDVQTLLIRNGENAGRTRRGTDGRDRPLDQAYPGSEHSALMQRDDGTIMIFTMATYEINGQLPNNRMQMLCAEINFDPMAGPQVSTLKYVTNLNGNRYRNANHIRVSKVFGMPVVSFNYAPDNRARTYQQVFGPGCTPLSDMTQIMQKNNDDCSETHSESPETIVQTDGDTAYLASVHGCNGNGRDDAWMAGTSVTKNTDGTFSIKKLWDLSIEANEERSRLTIIPTTIANLVVACGTAGNTQPPNKGVRCYGVNYDVNGEQGENAQSRLMWRQYIAERDGGTYYTQMRMAPINDATGAPTNMAIADYQMLTQRRRRGKGTAQLKAVALTFKADGVDVMNVAQDNLFPASDATHASICQTQYGTTGQEQSVAMLMSDSVNGSPGAFATAEFVKYDAATRMINPIQKVGLKAAIDNAWLPNIYGNNPNTQGRNFISCFSGIKNPGYHVTGGYMSDVKNFVAVPANTRRMREGATIAEDKLALELVLVPTVIDEPATTDPTDPGTTDPTDPNNNPDNPTTPTDPTNPTDPGNNSGSGASGVGGCSTGASGGAGSLAFLGLALLAIRRRRN